jgi:hypothetical protein
VKTEAIVNEAESATKETTGESVGKPIEATKLPGRRFSFKIPAGQLSHSLRRAKTDTNKVREIFSGASVCRSCRHQNAQLSQKDAKSMHHIVIVKLNHHTLSSTILCGSSSAQAEKFYLARAQITNNHLLLPSLSLWGLPFG